MDVFALQEELDNAKVARVRHASGAGSRRGTGVDSDKPGGNPGAAALTSSNSLHQSSETRDASDSTNSTLPPHLIRDEDTGQWITATPLHPASAEYKLRQRYLVFTDDIIGRGGFGEVLLAQSRDVPLIGNLTFAPISALLLPSVSMRWSQAQSTTAGSTTSPVFAAPLYSTSAVSLGSVSLQMSTQQHMPLGLSVGLSSSSHLSPTSTSALANGQHFGPTGVQCAPNTSAAHAAALQGDVPLFAVKRVDKRKTNAKGLSQIYSEVETLSLLSHPNIVRLQEVFQDAQHMFIVMEYVRGGELGKVLKRVGRFSEPVARSMCLSLLLAIEYIHERGIVHRDLKPANCLLVKETVFSSSTGFHFAQLHHQAVLSAAPPSPDYGVAQAGSNDLPSPTDALNRTNPHDSTHSHDDVGDRAGSRGSSVADDDDALNGRDQEDREMNPSNKHTIPTTAAATSPSIGAAGGFSFPPHASLTSNPPSALEFTLADYSGLKIADFGFAAMVGRAECLTTYCGTTHFMAPEVVGRDGAHYGKPVDMWSFGVIVYNLLSGALPFTAATSDRLAELITKGNIPFQSNSNRQFPYDGARNIWDSISSQAKDFIEKLLVVDGTKRLTAQEALRHPWIRVAYTEETLGDYPAVKGVMRGHSNFYKKRTARGRLAGAVHAVVAAHRLLFLAKVQGMRREGMGDIPILRNFPFLIHGRFEPTNRIASASSKRFMSNMPALRRLAEMVSVSHSVEILDVSGNNIDDLGLVQLIVKVTFSHPSLVHLNMERNPIPPLAARSLLRLARSMTHRLTVINVNHTNLGSEVIAQIDACLKETVRKRAEAAVAGTPYAGSSGGSSSSSPLFVASSPILRHDAAALRVGSAAAAHQGSTAMAAGSPVVGPAGSGGAAGPRPVVSEQTAAAAQMLRHAQMSQQLLRASSPQYSSSVTRQVTPSQLAARRLGAAGAQSLPPLQPTADSSAGTPSLQGRSTPSSGSAVNAARQYHQSSTIRR